MIYVFVVFLVMEWIFSFLTALSFRFRTEYKKHGFNIATNITTDEDFNAMTALTHEEVKMLINDLPTEEQEKIYSF